MVCRSDASDSHIYSMQESRNGELSQSPRVTSSCSIIHYMMLRILLSIFTASGTQLMMWDGTPYDATVMWPWQQGYMILRLEITYYKVWQPNYCLCKASSPSQDVRFQSKQVPHSYAFTVHFFGCGPSRRISSNEAICHEPQFWQ